MSLRSALERVAVRDFFGLSSPCLPFLFVGDAREGLRGSTKAGCTISEVLAFLLLREVWPLVMLLPKSCIFLTDLLNLRLNELLRDGSSACDDDGPTGVVGDAALGTALTFGRKLCELCCECPPIGRRSCRLLERWLRQKANLDSSVGKCGLRRSLEACSEERKSDQLMPGRWVLLLGQAWPSSEDADKSAAVSSRDSDVLRGTALAKSMSCMCPPCSSWL